MDGDISVSSQEHQGTIFSLNIVLDKSADPHFAELALANEGEIKRANSSVTASERAARKEAVCLLVVEDNAVNMMVMKGVLAKLGYQNIEKAQDGLEAVEKAAQGSYDLILMDCQMPKLDGYAATRRLRELGIKVPIVAMTAHAMSGDREKCFEAGMDDYLTKPIAIDKLGAMLEQWLLITVDPAA